MSTPLNTLVTCLHRRQPPPFDWIVEHTADGTIAPVWCGSVPRDPLDMFNVVLALDDGSFRRPRRVLVAALLEARRVTEVVGSVEIFRQMKSLNNEKLARRVKLFAAVQLGNGEWKEGRPFLLAIESFGTWLESRSHIYARRAFQMISNIHGVAAAIARAVPPPTVDEILAATSRS